MKTDPHTLTSNATHAPGGVIYWFRNDLRLHDQPALRKAIDYAQRHNTWLLPVYVHDTRHNAQTAWGFTRMGAHPRHWLAAALDGLAVELKTRKSKLLVLQGNTANVVQALYTLAGASVIFCEAIQAPEEIADIAALRNAGVNMQAIWQSTLIAPEDMPFAPDQLPDTFTVFRQDLERAGVQAAAPLDAPIQLPAWPAFSESFFESLSDLHGVVLINPGDNQNVLLANDINMPDSNDSAFPYYLPGFNGSEKAALAYLDNYCKRGLPHTYKTTRNGLIGADYSSKWSPWLATGALSARQAWAAIQCFEADQGANEGTYWLWFELLWRDYFRWLHHKYGVQLYHPQGLAGQRTRNPDSSKRTSPNHNVSNRQSLIANVIDPALPPHDPAAFKRWCSGNTGHAFIDAGLNELVLSGYVSNRIRQNMASFLIHDLACDWRAGAAWFEANLIDYDVYSNQGNWLYLSGGGTDPRGSRRFNPDKQAHDYDRDGAYRRLWAKGCKPFAVD